jgi:hypothetical protein
MKSNINKKASSTGSLTAKKNAEIARVGAQNRNKEKLFSKGMRKGRLR